MAAPALMREMQARTPAHEAERQVSPMAPVVVGATLIVLVLVEVDGIAHQPMYLRRPPLRDPGFSEVKVTLELKGLLAMAESPS